MGPDLPQMERQFLALEHIKRSAQQLDHIGQTLKRSSQEALSAVEEEVLQKFSFLIIFVLNFLSALV